MTTKDIVVRFAPSVALVLALAGMARADSYVRERMTLGQLVDRSDRIVLARVVHGPPGRVRLEVEQAVLGAVETLEFPESDVKCREGERALFFLRRAKVGMRAPATELHRILVADDAAAAEVLAATRARLPALGEKGRKDGDALQRALLSELASTIGRVREDAQIDLLERRELLADDTARVTVATALGAALEAHEPSHRLLALAARVPSAPVLGHAVAAALAAESRPVRDAAAKAIRAVPGGSGLAAGAFEKALAGPDERQAVNAAHLLGALAPEGAVAALAAVRASERSPVRLAALEALSLLGGDDAAAALASAAESPSTSGDEARLALAGLALSHARVAPSLLARIARGHADGKLRRLALRLGHNPALTAQLVVEAPERDPSEKDAIPARVE